MFVRINQALDASLSRRKDNEKGFTLIELLVVVIIIGILAAIAIPVFIGQQNGAKEAAAKSDLANVKTAIVAYAAKYDATLPTGSGALLRDFGYVQTANVGTPTWTGTVAANTLCISILSENGTSFSVGASGAVVTAATC